MDYSRQDLLDAYRRAGVCEGKVVYVTGNFGRLGRYESKDKATLFQDHFDVLMELLGETGTLVVPTHSFKLVNTDEPFDPHLTPSETGPFSDFIRQQDMACRQFHPFSSSTAIGAQAQEICGGKSRHVYGAGTPFDAMVKRDALFLALGKEARNSVSLVHHVELAAAVPYRYVKEFMKPVVRQEAVQVEPFYLHVLYRDMEVERDRNVTIMASFEQQHELHKVPLGRSFIESFSMSQFYDHVLQLMIENPFIWLRKEPQTKPFQK
ncbi:AAC(3) family N-acetyltransferase [Rhodanobacter aciditrophus]|uniref:Aminoglycoside N(3)-acetyltransferase n=1 Tax=Rhodanobacter aciditrophus TaxID=1623218 RepID=A0ABW4B2H0_9GAMM